MGVARAAPRAPIGRPALLVAADDARRDAGNGPAVAGDDLTDQALNAEAAFRQTSCLTAAAQPLRSLADLEPTTPAVMHGSSFHGDGGAVLRALANGLEERFSPEAEPRNRACWRGGAPA
ncbi:hypothetical protein [Streptomyces sp. HUAS TT7]|uniref:hypothetical protein n=1 Tax=Streptomyces sp. HUAS TT7 TaxID=3447507 RepID=UPI003F65FC7A